MTALRAGATLLTYQDWDMRITTNAPSLITTPNSTVEYIINPESLGGFDEPIHLAVRPLGDYPGIFPEFLDTTISPDEKGILAGLQEIDPHGKVRIHTISVGDVSRALMTAIAKERGGRHAHVEK